MQYLSSYSNAVNRVEIPVQYSKRNAIFVPDKDGHICERPIPGNIKPTPVWYVGIDSPEEVGEKRFLLPSGSSRWKSKADKDNFSAIRKSGAVKMTPWSAGSASVQYFVVELNPIVETYAGGVETDVATHEYNSKCMGTIVDHKYVWKTEVTRRVSQRRTSFNYIKEDFGDIPHYKMQSLTSLETLANAAKASVVSDLAKGYDLLTEIGEFSESARMILNLIESAKRPTELFKAAMKRYNHKPGTKMSKDLASAWLQYRYGIMPIVYSILDIIETSGAYNQRYKTSRSRETFELRAPLYRDMRFPHLIDEGTHKVDISAVGKKRFVNGITRLLDQIQFNPLVTSWELVKFSWVVDWFINVGDWITAQSQAFIGGGGEGAYCISFKTTKHVNTSLYIPERTDGARLVTNYRGLNGGAKRSQPPKVYTSDNNPGGIFLLKTEMENSYRRELFTPSDVYLDFNPNMNVKRSLDALSLAVGKTSFRRFL